MAIKITRQGVKEFKGTCDNCNAEFTYELSDLTANSHLNCPCCGTVYLHKQLRSYQQHPAWIGQGVLGGPFYGG